ncbi:MAG: shikimate kinase [Planctomycetota bacterium]
MNQPKSHLYLTGYRGCGKSTVRKLLAGRLGWPSVDLDDLIEEEAGCSIVEIFQREHEAGFRRRESEMLRSVSAMSQRIIALGGGTILDHGNQSLIHENGFCIWLDADNATLVRRIAGDSTTADRRPALTDQPLADEVNQVMARRRPIYRAVADITVDTTDRSIDEIVDEIVSKIPGS